MLPSPRHNLRYSPTDTFARLPEISCCCFDIGMSEKILYEFEVFTSVVYSSCKECPEFMWMQHAFSYAAFHSLSYFLFRVYCHEHPNTTNFVPILLEAVTLIDVNATDLKGLDFQISYVFISRMDSSWHLLSHIHQSHVNKLDPHRLEVL